MTERGSHSVIRSAAALGLVAIIGTALLTVVHHLTAERIEAEERRVVQQQLGQILPADSYDNVLLDDRFSFSDTAWFSRGQTVTAYRARKQGQAVAVILRFKAVDGYNGDIHLLAGIRVDGSLSGVRVISHKETPGLGDAIEAEKSNWVLGFNGKSLFSPSERSWTVKKDGGQFDQFTGATITPRAVVNAVHSALEYFESASDTLFETPADQTSGNKRVSES
jgi:electron transport complex protein RnfG